MDHYTYLVHSGTKGMKWGQRRYQNKDGSLTALGRAHYGVGAVRNAASAGAKKVGSAVSAGAKSVSVAARKKFRPTEADLDEKIKAQREANNKARALKEKKAELKGLQKDVNYDVKKEKAAKREAERTKFSDLTDANINDRINRLKKEAELANLERMKNMSPRQRMVDEALQGALKITFNKIGENVGTEIGKAAISAILKKDKGKDKPKDNDKDDKDSGKEGKDEKPAEKSPKEEKAAARRKARDEKKAVRRITRDLKGAARERKKLEKIAQQQRQSNDELERSLQGKRK